ncbi:777_t:CDS:2 [Paraglomus brasilianum]|uniref:777_t:CDS:1 n=1 Tax=Paraglomus brasilianum TaxID=144538 RepID=A0A9N8ZGF4_9GLOM|nr:777_t:CDS:2 [Paraglomus brasilianum]
MATEDVSQEYPNPVLGIITTRGHESALISCANGRTFEFSLPSPAQLALIFGDKKIPNNFMVFRKLFQQSLRKDEDPLCFKQRRVSIISGWAWRAGDNFARNKFKRLATEARQYQNQVAPSMSNLPLVYKCGGCGLYNRLSSDASGVCMGVSELLVPIPGIPEESYQTESLYQSEDLYHQVVYRQSL